MQNDLISRSALLEEFNGIYDRHFKNSAYQFIHDFFKAARRRINKAPAVDAVEVVRCKECKHGVWNEDEEMYQCVEGADYDPELAMYHGFICYKEADFFCKRGERK
jgi:hypothetical protein